MCVPAGVRQCNRVLCRENPSAFQLWKWTLYFPEMRLENIKSKGKGISSHYLCQFLFESFTTGDCHDWNVSFAITQMTHCFFH